MSTYSRILEVAKEVSKERGYKIYIVFNIWDESYSFTQDKNIYLTDLEKIVVEVDEDKVTKYEKL